MSVLLRTGTILLLIVATARAEGAPPPFELGSGDAAAEGQRIATYAAEYDRGWRDEVWLGTMTLKDGAGDAVERTVSWLVLEGEAGNKSLIRFLAPAEMKGVAALIHEHVKGSDDNWLYLPADRKVRRISGAGQSASFQGSEFAYEDLRRAMLVDKYEWRFLEGDELVVGDRRTPCYRVEASPNYADTGYSRLVVWFGRETWQRERVEFYDKANQPLKTMVASDYEHVHGRYWRARKVSMLNHQTKKQTDLVLRKLFVDLGRYNNERTGKPRPNLTDDDFTTRALGGS